MLKKWLLSIGIAVFVLSGVLPALAVESEWHGQFRINYYALSQKDTYGFGTEAERLRWRPTWDVKVSDDVSMHMQLNIGHIKANTSNARFNQNGAVSTTTICTEGNDLGGPSDISCSSSNSGGEPAVGLRHAYIKFTTPGVGGKIMAGLVPISDKFGDTLFSGDWDFNPLSIVYTNNFGVVDLRLGTGKLTEGEENRNSDDDDIYIADADFSAGTGTVGASIYRFVDRSTPTPTNTQDYIGVRTSQDLNVLKLNAFLVANSGKIESNVAGVADIKNSGIAAKVEVLLPAGPANVGVMVLYATGKDGTDASKPNGFITPMTLIGHTGYWGYTGKLNIQGPTDTGIDCPVNIDGAAYCTGTGVGSGIMTLQAKADFPIADKLSGYVAAGWFQHQKENKTLAAAQQKKDIGFDVIAMGKLNLGQNLNLEAGIDYAAIDKNAEGLGNTTEDNTITLLFARLQLEY